ncbi:MAG: DUF6152 family protein [Pseudomonadota bacterium]|nr:DUF6152 family protein [Pseudomonadota bacterium]
MGRLVFCLLAFWISGGTWAHHSMTWHFDRDQEITIEGVVRDFKFVNPHGRLLLDVINESGGTEVWDCELNGAASAARNGWTTDLFRVGQGITVEGFAARRNERECYYQSGVFSDGTRIDRGEQIEADVAVISPSVERPSTVGSSNVPNFGGVWRGAGPFGGPPRPGEANPHVWILSEAGRQALDAYDPITEDPSLECRPVSIRRLWSNGSPTEIRQDESIVIIHHEWMDAERTVYLNQDTHPEGLTGSALGHSIGWYEGRTLVIDTVAYEPGFIYQFPGLPHSDQLHTVERLTLSDGGRAFDIAWVAEDPEYFVDSLSGAHNWALTDTPVGKYNCVHPELGVSENAN